MSTSLLTTSIAMSAVAIVSAAWSIMALIRMRRSHELSLSCAAKTIASQHMTNEKLAKEVSELKEKLETAMASANHNAEECFCLMNELELWEGRAIALGWKDEPSEEHEEAKPCNAKNSKNCKCNGKKPNRKSRKTMTLVDMSHRTVTTVVPEEEPKK